MKATHNLVCGLSQQAGKMIGWTVPLGIFGEISSKASWVYRLFADCIFDLYLQLDGWSFPH
jgi:hypothetical protein